MQQFEALIVISKYLSRFGEQVHILNNNSEFSINIQAENVLIKILNTLFSCELENVNHSQNANYNTIDLRDVNGKLAIQVTATSNISKIKKTLASYREYKHYLNNSKLIIFVLGRRQKSYNILSLDKATGSEFNFNQSCDIVDLAFIHKKLNELNDLSKILTVKSLLEEQFADHTSAPILDDIKTFYNLCLAIYKLMKDNEKLFRSFGPQSSAYTSGQVRWDLTLWYKFRLKNIIPNNKRIQELSNQNEHLIPDEYNYLFDAFSAHAFAFEEHCNNANFDYSEFRFPVAFQELITNTIRTQSKELESLTPIIEDLKVALNTRNVHIRINVVGSVLISPEFSNDFDLLLFIDTDEKQNLEKLHLVLQDTKFNFKSKYYKRLHVTVFTKSEFDKYQLFINSNETITI